MNYFIIFCDFSLYELFSSVDRFWLMDCQHINESAKMATELYREAIAVPFMSKFVVFTKSHDPSEARMRVFCMTDDRMDKTLENQEHFAEVARSRDVEVIAINYSDFKYYFYCSCESNYINI